MSAIISIPICRSSAFRAANLKQVGANIKLGGQPASMRALAALSAPARPPVACCCCYARAGRARWSVSYRSIFARISGWCCWRRRRSRAVAARPRSRVVLRGDSGGAACRWSGLGRGGVGVASRSRARRAFRRANDAGAAGTAPAYASNGWICRPISPASGRARTAAALLEFRIAPRRYRRHGCRPAAHLPRAAQARPGLGAARLDRRAGAA